MVRQIHREEISWGQKREAKLNLEKNSSQSRRIVAGAGCVERRCVRAEAHSVSPRRKFGNCSWADWWRRLHEYVVDGRAGQVMTIEITSNNGAVIVNAGSAIGKSFSIDMTGGDHLLSVVNTGRRATNYTLTVSIR